MVTRGAAGIFLRELMEYPKLVVRFRTALKAGEDFVLARFKDELGA